MPLLPQAQTTSDNFSDDNAIDTDNSHKTDKATGDTLPLGYKGLLEDHDNDDKVWDNFTNTIEAVRYDTYLFCSVYYAAEWHVSSFTAKIDNYFTLHVGALYTSIYNV